MIRSSISLSICDRTFKSSYVVLIVKCVFILKMLCLLNFLRRNIKRCTHKMEKECDKEYYVKKNTLNLFFSFPNVTFPATFQFLIIFGAGFEVFTVVGIRNVV